VNLRLNAGPLAPLAEVGAIHPKAMPVILTRPEEVETWMTAPLDDALKLQRPLPDGALFWPRARRPLAISASRASTMRL